MLAASSRAAETPMGARGEVDWGWIMFYAGVVGIDGGEMVWDWGGGILCRVRQ